MHFLKQKIKIGLMISSSDVVQELIEKTYRELNQSSQIIQKSRVWKDPEGYRYLFPWSNLVLLRFIIRLFTSDLPKSEYRRKAQMDDAGRSAVRNIEEGFKRSTTREYLEFVDFSQGSLEEVKGDVRELAEDGFLKSVPGSSLAKLSIDLKELNLCLRNHSGSLKENRGEVKEFNLNQSSNRGSLNDDKRQVEDRFVYRPLTDLYLPLKSLKSSDLTYEIFMELINKTDYLLRQLVISLEKKLANEKKFYQVEQIKLKRYERRS